MFQLTEHRSAAPALHRGCIAAALLGLALNGAALIDSAMAQGAVDTVSWTLSAPATANLKPGGRVDLTLRGEVVDGWHVYALEQPSGGPIPLRVTLDQSDIAAADGAPAADPPEKVFDTSFRFETLYYSKPFTLTVPVRLGADVAPGPQQIPVSVRFQTCNGKICHPPKTIRLSAPVNVRKAG
jgi:DsbC/DsbD-like thiol-disulfide interchange protein